MFMSVLGQCVLKSGIQARLSGHSFRRGGATWLSRLGVPLDIIKQLGYWSSDAVARYIEPNFSQKVSVMQSFGKSLPWYAYELFPSLFELGYSKLYTTLYYIDTNHPGVGEFQPTRSLCDFNLVVLSNHCVINMVIINVQNCLWFQCS